MVYAPLGAKDLSSSKYVQCYCIAAILRFGHKFNLHYTVYRNAEISVNFHLLTWQIKYLIDPYN